MQENPNDGLRRGDYGWYDAGRRARIGIPEAIFATGKSDAALVEMVEFALEGEGPVLVTRFDPSRFPLVADRADWLAFPPIDEGSPYLTLVARPLRLGQEARVAILAAGSSDRVMALEAQAVLTALGVKSRLILDCGVSAIERTMVALDEASDAEVFIVLAGFEGALATVVAASVAQPVIGVPTSVGYGVARGGETAMASMLASCAQGLMVMGIDNGFGAACAALRILGTGPR
ncbi:nickel pincer cofactor biosynthesis protein LarB [Ferrimicrobium sp.]|uniref:nickel pincer cofactor biosynthesis protein LarB n=1 Tax=Ferrimicrobium sp. TaxID=2926050 RepID=UPI0026352230|nr:nickel pincer cofactor biosynthesis protein LarB [Ferrimicrobium sp.]